MKIKCLSIDCIKNSHLTNIEGEHALVLLYTNGFSFKYLHPKIITLFRELLAYKP